MKKTILTISLLIISSTIFFNSPAQAGKDRKHWCTDFKIGFIDGYKTKTGMRPHLIQYCPAKSQPTQKRQNKDANGGYHSNGYGVGYTTGIKAANSR